MKNKNFTGHWIGIFSEEKDGETKIDFTEELRINLQRYKRLRS